MTCVLGALFAACGTGGTDHTSGSSGAGAAKPSGAGGAHASNSSGDIWGTGGKTFTVGAGSGSGKGGSGGEETCGGETTQAQNIPLDIYLMLDSSGSMLDTTGGSGSGPSKWTAVTQALSTFFADPQSAGLGVGLQHFPSNTPGIPATCSQNSQCPGSTGPCLLKICSGLSVLAACVTDADCASHGSSQCVPLGQCGTAYCVPANGALCSGNGMPCNAVTTSTCINKDSCQAADYAAPAVEIALLNGASSALGSAITSWTPGGATPTGPALGGAVQHARDWANAHPTHKVVVVLATDGLPTECSPQSIPAIAQLAAQGASGTPSVGTFAIGVFAPADITAGAKDNLDKIAAAGGTGQAFIIDTSQNVAQQYLDALNAIRGTKLACEYAVPPPGDAGMLDFGKVNVEHTPPGSSTPSTIGYVGQVANCDPLTGGWYYDVDPAVGTTPTKIIMCPATCTTFGATIGGQIDIRVGCKTVFQPPPK